MKKLSKDLFNQVSAIIQESARPLEKRIYDNYFQQSGTDKIVSELKKFQNHDGGFGNGIEPDIRLPLSSPMASSVAFQHLISLDSTEKSIDLIKSGISYFEDTFLSERNGWFVLGREVNDYPHAPWWHFNENQGMTIIDQNWGNNSAEIIGYLYKYREFVYNLNVEELIKYAVDYWKNQSDDNSAVSDNEVLCFIRLSKMVPDHYSQVLEDKIAKVIEQIICRDIVDWKSKYVPKPLDFVTDPESNRYGISDELIEKNLDLWVDILTEDKKIVPTWEWSRYVNEWEKARKEWIGILTVKALICLDKFGRIEGKRGRV